MRRAVLPSSRRCWCLSTVAEDWWLAGISMSSLATTMIITEMMTDSNADQRLTSNAQGSVFWAVNGVGLSLVIPNGQSLIADYYEDLERGKAFGALYLTGAVGAMIGALYATNIGAFLL